MCRNLWKKLEVLGPLAGAGVWGPLGMAQGTKRMNFPKSSKPTSALAGQVKKISEGMKGDVKNSWKGNQKEEGWLFLFCQLLKKECLPSPERECAPHHIGDLQLTPLLGERNEEDTLPSPPLPNVEAVDLVFDGWQGGPEESFLSPSLHILTSRQTCSTL